MRSIIYAILFALLAAGAAQADDVAPQNWPQRPVTIVVPFPAGGSVDLIARIAQQELQASFGSPFVIENRPGAGATIGTAYAARMANDGYTFLFATLSASVIAEFVYSKLPYDTLRDFEPIALLVRQPNVLVVGPKIPSKTVAEFIDYMKANDNKLNFGSAGIGTPSHLGVVMFELATGTHATHVPFRGTNEEATSLMNGTVDFAIDSMSSLWPQVQAGTIRALAVSSEARSALAPDLPTIGETLHGFAVSSWQGLMAPKGTPRPIVEKIAAALKERFARPDVQSELMKIGGVPALLGPDEFTAYIKSEQPKWRDVIKASGVHLD